MDVSLVAAFALIQLALSVIPGPAVLVTSSASLGGGMRDGVRAACGVLLGNAVYIAVAGLGVGALIASAPWALKAISLAGAAWLTWLAMRMLASSFRDASQGGDAGEQRSVSRRPFMAALMTQLSNPKSIVFFGAMLPQFVSPSGWPAPGQMAMLGVVAIMIELPILLAYAWLATAAGRVHRGRVVWLERGGALVLLAAAAAATAR